MTPNLHRRPPILTAIDAGGQAPSPGRDLALSPALETFVTRVRALTDDERLAVADARRSVDEEFHEKALRAGAEALAGRGEEYVRARALVARAHVPERLAAEGEGAPQGRELERWNEVARLVQIGIDDGLVAVLASPVLHPNHMRELHRSLAAAFSRE